MDIGVGSVLRLRNIRHYFDDGKSWAEFKAAKGKTIVIQVLGFEPQQVTDETALDVMKRMDEMGWEPKNKVKKKNATAIRKAK